MVYGEQSGTREPSGRTKGADRKKEVFITAPGKSSLEDAKNCRMDGYSTDPWENYADQKMGFYQKKVLLEAMNEGIRSVLKEYSRIINIEFITSVRL